MNKIYDHLQTATYKTLEQIKLRSLPRDRMYSACLSTAAHLTPLLNRWWDILTQNGVRSSSRLTNIRPSQPYVIMWFCEILMWNLRTWWPLAIFWVTSSPTCSKQQRINTYPFQWGNKYICLVWLGSASKKWIHPWKSY